MPEPGPEFVCLQVGEGLPDLYVERLYRMLQRHCPQPFRLTCLTDRERRFEEPIEQIEVEQDAAWRTEMRVTQHKLKLFRKGGWPYPEFFFLDTTLVIQSSLSPLLDFAQGRPEPLIAVDDWEWDTINTSVMRIRRDAGLAAIFSDFSLGKQYPVRLKGDQDFADAAIKANGLERLVATWPKGMVASYKGLRRLRRLHPTQASRKLAEAAILKFHGKPRPDQLADPGYWRWHLKRSPIWGIRDWRYLSDEIERLWR
ncbi:MAG: hypothetical protein HZC36_08555 [Armatimonadetes bacterium]|nr:hypothetical protein [Armatimonadota bacterium]